MNRVFRFLFGCSMAIRTKQDPLSLKFPPSEMVVTKKRIAFATTKLVSAHLFLPFETETTWPEVKIP